MPRKKLYRQRRRLQRNSWIRQENCRETFRLECRIPLLFFPMEIRLRKEIRLRREIRLHRREKRKLRQRNRKVKNALSLPQILFAKGRTSEIALVRDRAHVRARVRLRIVAKGGEDRNGDEIDHAQILESGEEGLQEEISFLTVVPTKNEILRNGSRNVNGHTTSDGSGTKRSVAGHATRTTKIIAAGIAASMTAARKLVSSRGRGRRRERRRGRAIYTPGHLLLLRR